MPAIWPMCAPPVPPQASCCHASDEERETVMRALIATGQSEALVTLGKAERPRPRPGEVLIKVEAFSVNRGEMFSLQDRGPGWRPGKDVAGVVVQAAADAAAPGPWPARDRAPGRGGWAQYAAVPLRSLAVIPDSISAIQAAALPLAGLTALRLLRLAGNITGQRVLLTGASGGVGHYVTELAAAAGAEVTAVTASAERGRRLAELAQPRSCTTYPKSAASPIGRTPPRP